MNKTSLSIITICLVVLSMGIRLLIGKNNSQTSNHCVSAKINFNLQALDANGLIGPEDGKTSVDYEFCIPIDKHIVQEVQNIDADIKCRHSSAGRIGCGKTEYLCIGSRAFKDYRNILCQLSKRNYIQHIDRVFWE